MSSYSLISVEAKLDRAAEHLNLLDEAIDTYLTRSPYRFVGEKCSQGQSHHWALFLEVDELPPDSVWGPIIGDAVHNLRSALDHLAWQFATTAARDEKPWRIEFPIVLDDPANSPGPHRHLTRALELLRPELRPVVKAAQPYVTGDTQHPLWVLQTLWNADKHRMLHTAGFLFGTPSEDVAEGYGYEGWSFGPIGREGPPYRSPIAHGMSSPDPEGARINLEFQMNAHKTKSLDVSLGHSNELPSRPYPYIGLPIRQVLRRTRRFIDSEIIAPLPRI